MEIWRGREVNEWKGGKIKTQGGWMDGWMDGWSERLMDGYVFV